MEGWGWGGGRGKGSGDRELRVDEECMREQHGIKGTARYSFRVSYTDMAMYTLGCVRKLRWKVPIALANKTYCLC